MGTNLSKPSLFKAVIAACALVLGTGAAMAQSTVTLTAGATTTTLPDGQAVPMWGYTCGAPVNASCTAMNGTAQLATTWQPPLIRVPAGPLTINLVNNLSGAVPTSLVIVGQLGGGLGALDNTGKAIVTTMPSPPHAPQGTTWPGTVGTADPSSCLPGGDPGAAGTFCPPAQAPRVRSFGTEVAVGGNATLTWANLRPGTYLIESGTQPSIQGPMGLYGMLVVSEPDVSGVHQAYGTPFDADVPMLLSEIDPVQNTEVAQVVQNAGFSDTTVWRGTPGACGDVAQPATVHTCYPPAVNYSPLYYLVNGVSFDRTNTAASALVVPPAGAQKNVLLRFVNAGLRMHVPSVVGAKLTLLAEDGNKLPGNARLQAEVMLAAGKTYDVAIQPTRATTPGTYDAATYPMFDRALSLSTGNQRGGGMQAYINVNGGGAQAAVAGTAGSAGISAVANPDNYYVVAGNPLVVSDPSKGVIANDVGVYGVAVSGTAPTGLSLNANGTFTYAGAAPLSATPVVFSYCANGGTTACTTVSLNLCTSANSCLASAPVASDVQFISNVATRYSSPPPGVLAGVTNDNGLALTAVGTGLNADGSFVATPTGPCPATLSPAAPAGAACAQFSYQAKNSQGTLSAAKTATVIFLPASGLAVNVYDAPSTQPGKTKVAIADYRWIIEEDRTFWIDPQCQVNSSGTRTDKQGNACPPLPVESLGYNFHTANMPVVASGCVGTTSCEAGQTQQGVAVVCDVGNGVCRAGAQKTELLPSAVHLDPSKRYFISVLPGDGVNPTIGGAGGPDPDGKAFSIAKNCGAFNPSDPRWAPGDPGGLCGHEMGGAQIAKGQTAVNIALQQTPLPTAKLSVFVYQDDNPLNGENDAGGGVDIVAPNEAGLGGFEIKLFDQAGGLGDNTGQPTYDEFNQPLTNALAGHIDPVTKLDACPITKRSDSTGKNFVGMIPTCPKYESDGVTISPLAGQVVIENLYPGLYEVQAYPAADRIGRGEEWLQTNTLDGGKPHEAFIKPNEPGYFQEFGPGGFHVAIGFANPKIINDRKGATGDGKGLVCSGQACTSTLTVNVSNNHMSRTPDQRTYSSGNYDHYAFTQCYVSVGLPDGIDFAFEKCTDGKAVFNNMPGGTYKIAVFDQWNDIMLDGLVSSVQINSANVVKDLPVTQWRTNLATRTYIDANGNGIPDRDANGNDLEAGLALVNTNIRYRDGSFGFFNNTDLNGYAGFNEVFPFMNWLVVETSSTRFKPTGIHTVYDAGGPPDGTGVAGAGNSLIASHLANTVEKKSLPAVQRVPGARYCVDADCISAGTFDPALTNGSSGAVMPPQAWGVSQGWQGLLGQDSFIEFGMKPFAENENGGINGHVIYASTRPFDDPSLSLQLSWEPGVPRVQINLYSKSTDEFGNDKLTLVDTTKTTSWDDWAQGFRKDAAGNLMKDASGKYIPNMNCPGQDNTSPFFATLANSKEWLDPGNLDPANPGKLPLASNSQFKCYDGWSQLNQIQPAPYDGMYAFPSVTRVDPVTGKPAGTNCTTCIANPDTTDPFRAGTPMLPPGKYVVEVIVPPGYELVKEEDKNILLGDVYIAPVTQQFAGFGNIFIMPDQAAVNAHYNPNSPGGLNLTNNIGSVTFPRHEGDTGSIESFWPCVGAKRMVPDFNSLFPGAGQAAPFAGAMRNLCDRKEVVLQDQATVLAKFFVFSSTHIAGHFAGTITNDFASEFDPFSPQFGEKFGPPNLPVGLRDFNGNEVARVYADQWGIYNGLYFSSWSVNPPNPTGYAPQMSIACMNDPGPIVDTRLTVIDSTTGLSVVNPTLGQMITDPAYSPAYSNFCYETPFMPGFTAYMDTPVIPTMAFADNYNLPDTEYPDKTPAILSVVNSNAAVAQGPWVTSGAAATAASSATVSFTVSGIIRCQTATCANRSTITFPGGTVSCTFNGTGGPNCSGNTANTRANNVATYIRANIATLLGAGYSATGTNANVSVTAPAGAGPNGTNLVTATSNATVNPAAPVLAGGLDAAPAIPAAMDIVITALGDKAVINPNFSGPNSTTAPYNQKTITRHYGFGGTAGTAALVDAAGVSHPLTVSSWSDMSITGTVPADLPLCNTASSSYRGANATARCGQLVITAADGKRSIDAITVTVGGTRPWLVTPAGVTAPGGQSVKDYGTNFGRMGPSPIQTAIDSASPGDLIIVAPGTYRENLIMWKPVRLQGVGAAAVTVNADAHPAGKMDQWRRQVDCVFGLDLEGIPNVNNTLFDKDGAYSCPASMHQRVDRIQFEAITGWDASGNGNLAQVLQEPTLMGAYEGAGITVLGRGIRIPGNSTDFWGNDPAAAGAFPQGAVYINTGDCNTASNVNVNGRDYGTGNFYCNPSRIDGLSIINSSQGGGGMFIHGWAQNLEVANNRISGNHGTLAGGINLGNGETPAVYLNDGTICSPLPGFVTADTCPPIPVTSLIPNSAIPFQWNTNVRIHHNMIYNNASIGDALFTGTPAGAGGITVSAGADGYSIDHNWIAGNLSTGDGGGVQQLGVSFNARIANNYVLFNQSTNPTLPTNGGGIVIEGANEPRMLNGTECGGTTDADCPPGLGEGTGQGLVIDANLILGNSAESGSGGGLRLSQINGTEVVNFPLLSAFWYGVSVTNNIIANNVAGWDGGGVSLQDALKVNFVNNTVTANDTTASAGSLFKTLGAVTSTAPGSGCSPPTDPSLPLPPGCDGSIAPHGQQPAGLVTMVHTPNLLDALTPASGVAAVLCPANFGYNVLGQECKTLSKPLMLNNLFWHNRSFKVDIKTTTGTGNQSQQAIIGLTPQLNQVTTGDCTATDVTGVTVTDNFYWDIGLRTDDFAAGLLTVGANRLTVLNSILTNDQQGVVTASATNQIGAAPQFVAPFCNGARIPPENCASQTGQVTQASCKGYNTPVGASETTSTSELFAFNGIQPSATVDEGHNWLNLTYGPLTLNRPNATAATPAETMVASASVGLPSGAYSILATSPAAAGGTASANGVSAPAKDFFGTTRTGPVSIGAVQQVATASANVTGGPLVFGNMVTGVQSLAQTLTLHTTTNLTGISVVVTAPFSRPAGAAGGTCGATLAAAATCSINVVFTPTATGPATGTVTITASTAVAGSPVSLSGTGVAQPTRPTLGVLDTFNRAAANTLGASWNQATLLGFASIRIVDVTAGNTATGVANAASAGNAYWTAAFGNQQAAAFTITNATLNGDSLILKASGTPVLGVAPSFIRVRATGTQVVVETTTNFGVAVASTTLAGTFANGDTLTALADANGTVSVWKTTSTNTTTYVGSVATTFTGAGQIGIQLPGGARVDNFAGGTVP